MSLEKAILELKNMLLQFEDMAQAGCIVKLWVSSTDIDALQMAIEALEEKQRKEDDKR